MPVNDIIVTDSADLAKLAAGQPAGGDAAPPKQDDKPETPGAEETPAETTPESDTGEVKDDKSEVKPDKNGNGFQRKIDKLTRRAKELEEENERLRNQSPKTEKEPAKPSADAEPKRESFATDAEWVKAQARWEVRQELRDQTQQAQQAEEAEANKAVFDAHLQSISVSRQAHTDYDDVVNEAVSPWHEKNPAEAKAAQAFQVALVNLENSGEVGYYLATHPEEFAKLGELSPLKVQQAVWRISDSLLKSDDRPSSKKPVSELPAPIKPVGASGTKSTVNEDALSDDEWIRQRNKETLGRRKR
jgi:hypothetical protein